MTVSEKQHQTSAHETAAEVKIRPLEEPDLDTADHIMRVAFGTYLKAPDPVQVFGDSDHVHTRFHADPSTAFIAELEGEVIGSNFATRWGSFGFFGPLTVRVDLWDQGIASRLMEPVVGLFEHWGVRQAGLFTFPESPKHVGLYQKFGFWPRGLTPLMAKPVTTARSVPFARYSDAGEAQRSSIRDACRAVTDAIMPGLDLEREIVAVVAQDLGETVLLESGDELTGFAVCHCGAGTEAGSETCFIKFGAVMPGEGEEDRFADLLAACEALAAERGLGRLVAGVNADWRRAYRHLVDGGFRAFLNGLTMLTPAESGFDRPDALVINDLR